MAAATALLGWRGGLLGRSILGLLLIDTLVWMAPAAFSNVTHRDALLSTARSTALAVLAVTALVAILPGARRMPAPALVAGGGVAIAAILGLTRLLGVGDDVGVRPGDVVVSIRTNEFSTDALALEPGSVGLAVTNHDVFWHTFTIDELGLDLRVPNGGTRRVDLDLAPGTYRFVCAIPGHEQAGMVGTLTVG